MANLVSGTTLKNRYTITDQLGKGGMGEVYLALDESLDTKVAVKANHNLSSHTAAQFIREARLLASLKHPNLPRVIDYFTDDDSQYLVMDYVPGDDLKQIIEGNREVSLPQVMKWATQLGNALTYLHTQNPPIFHRDIKPANILFTADGHVKVTDFGIARALAQTSGTATGTILGSPHYLSPEQAKGQSSGPRSDVYSLGVMLYEMLTGRTPYEGETPVAIALQHVQGTPPPIRSLALGVPAALEAVVTRAMARDPEARFGTAAEMVAALEAVRAGLPAPVDPAATQVMAQQRPLDATVVMPAVRQAVTPRAPEPTPYVPLDDRGLDNRKLIFGLALFLAIVGGITVGVMFVPHGDVSTPGTTTGSATPSRKQIVVEDMVGRDAEMERTRLEDLCKSQGIQPPEVREMGQEDSPLDAGKITRQDPAGGTAITEGGIIQVWISTGFEKVDVPDVLGLPVADAQQMITGKNLTVGQVKEDYSSDYNEGFIAAQNPSPRSKVRANTPVTLIVSKGPKPVTPPTPQPPIGKPDVTVGPMEQLDNGKKTTIKVVLPEGSRDATVELRWLEGAHGSPGGGTVGPGNDFSSTVQGDTGSKLGVFVDGKQVRTVNF